MSFVRSELKHFLITEGMDTVINHLISNMPLCVPKVSYRLKRYKLYDLFQILTSQLSGISSRDVARIMQLVNQDLFFD